MNKLRKVLLSLVILFSTSLVIGQSKYDYLRLADNEYNAKNYYTATQYYLRVFDQYSDSSTTAFPYSRYNTLNTTKYIDQYFEVMYKLAESYRLFNDYTNAEVWYAKVNLLAAQQFPLTKLWYGVSLRANGKYEDALAQLTAFRSVYNQKDDISRRVDLEIAKCKYAVTAIKNPVDASVNRLDSLSINRRSSNFGAAIYKNDSSLVFTSSRRILAGSAASQNLGRLVNTDLGTSDSTIATPNEAVPELVVETPAEVVVEEDSINSVSLPIEDPKAKDKGKKKDKASKPAKESKKKDKAKDDLKPVKGKDIADRGAVAGAGKAAKAAKAEKTEKPKKERKSKKKDAKAEEVIPVLTADSTVAPIDTVTVPQSADKGFVTTESEVVKVDETKKVSEVLAPPVPVEALGAKKKRGFLSFGNDKNKSAKDSAEAAKKTVNPKKRKKPYNPPVYEDEEFYNTLFVTEREDTSKDWKIPQALTFEDVPRKGLFGGKDNDPVNQGTPSFTADKKTIFFSQWSGSDVRKPVYNIYRTTQYESGLWAAPIKLKLPLNQPGFRYMHPSISADSSKLFFTSDRPGGYGKLDIWYVLLDTAGDFSQPINVGPKVNTVEDDITPFYSDSLKTLFYATEGRMGLGGLDIFEAKSNAGKFDSSINLGYPINSSRDDAYLVVASGDTTRGYFSSDRNSDCCFEMYDFDYVFGIIRGRIFDTETKLALAGVPVRLIDAETNKELQRVFTDSDGYYYFRVSPNRIYKILAGSDDQLKDSRRVNTKGLKDGQVITLNNLELNNLVLDKPIEIKNIYYDFDRATLRKESESVLDTLANFLSENGNVVVEIGSHTDSRGTEEYNLDLSNRRSENVVNYLIYKGIPARLVRFKGYGETKPIAANENADGTDNEAGRQLNRRTEFKVVEILK